MATPEIFDKGQLVQKVWAALRQGELMQRKWMGFCGVHQPATHKPDDQDEAFLMTFLDAATSDGIPPYDGMIPPDIAVSAAPKGKSAGDWAKGAGEWAKGGAWGKAGGGGDWGKGGGAGDWGKGGGGAWGSKGGDSWGKGKGKGGGFDGGKGGGFDGGKGGGYDGGKGAGFDGGKGGGFDAGKGGGYGGGKGAGFDGGKGGKGASEPGKVFVGGLPRTAVEGSVGQMLSQFGTLTSVTVKYGDDGTCKGYAFGTFEDPSCVQSVVAASQAGSTVVDGKWVTCQVVDGSRKGDSGKGDGNSWKGGAAKGSSWDGGYKGSSKGYDNSWKGGGKSGGGGGGGKGEFGPRPGKVFVGGLPKDCSEDRVGAHFSQYGKISKILMKYSEEGVPRGFCFIEFEDPEVGRSLIAQSQAGATMMEGKWVDIKDADNGRKGGDKGGDKGGGKRKGGDDWGMGGGWDPAAKRPRTDDGWGSGFGGWGGGKGADKGWGDKGGMKGGKAWGKGY